MQIRLPQAQSMLFAHSDSAKFGNRNRWGWLRQYVGESQSVFCRSVSIGIWGLLGKGNR